MPELVGVLAVNDGLQKASRLEFEGDMVGPEAFAVDQNGTYHTHVPSRSMLATLLTLVSALISFYYYVINVIND